MSVKAKDLWLTTRVVNTPIHPTRCGGMGRRLVHCMLARTALPRRTRRLFLLCAAHYHPRKIALLSILRNNFVLPLATRKKCRPRSKYSCKYVTLNTSVYCVRNEITELFVIPARQQEEIETNENWENLLASKKGLLGGSAVRVRDSQSSSAESFMR